MRESRTGQSTFAPSAVKGVIMVGKTPQGRARGIATWVQLYTREASHPVQGSQVIDEVHVRLVQIQIQTFSL